MTSDWKKIIAWIFLISEIFSIILLTLAMIVLTILTRDWIPLFSLYLLKIVFGIGFILILIDYVKLKKKVSPSTPSKKKL